jgi:hypothetical protein
MPKGAPAKTLVAIIWTFTVAQIPEKRGIRTRRRFVSAFRTRYEQRSSCG